MSIVGCSVRNQVEPPSDVDENKVIDCGLVRGEWTMSEVTMDVVNGLKKDEKEKNSRN